MPQVSKYPIEKDVYNEAIDTFLKTIASLTTKQDVLLFFSEFLTPTEKIMFSKRLAVGLLVAAGYDYTKISSLLKVSTSTISRFSALYKYGEGYKRIVDRIKTDKEIADFLINLGEKNSLLASFGGKGSGTWKSVNKTLRSSKSRLLR